MVLSYSTTLNSKTGNTIRFVANEVKLVPDRAIEEVLAIGGIYANETQPDVDPAILAAEQKVAAAQNEVDEAVKAAEAKAVDAPAAQERSRAFADAQLKGEREAEKKAADKEAADKRAEAEKTAAKKRASASANK